MVVPDAAADKEQIRKEAVADVIDSWGGVAVPRYRVVELALVKYPWLFDRGEDVEYILERYFFETEQGNWL